MTRDKDNFTNTTVHQKIMRRTKKKITHTKQKLAERKSTHIRTHALVDASVDLASRRRATAKECKNSVDGQPVAVTL